MTIRYTATKARVHFGSIIRRATQGNEIIVERLGMPIVRISAYSKNDSIDNLRNRIAKYCTYAKNDATKFTRQERKRI